MNFKVRLSNSIMYSAGGFDRDFFGFGENYYVIILSILKHKMESLSIKESCDALSFVTSFFHLA